jgi:hypothetical protein
MVEQQVRDDNELLNQKNVWEVWQSIL